MPAQPPRPRRWKPSGCRSPQTASSRRSPAAARESRRACTTGPRRAGSILDGVAGLWCVNAGHGRKRNHRGRREADRGDGLRAAVPDGAPRPRSSSPRRLPVEISPTGLDRVFFTNSGSESVDTALKIALAYHRVRGEGARTRLIGRERGYHGVGFGGISVGGMVNNRKFFGAHAARRGPPAPHARPRAQRVLARLPAWGARPRRRSRAPRRAARRVEHRGRDRRADRRLHRRAAAAAGLSQAPARRSATATASCSFSTR